MSGKLVQQKYFLDPFSFAEKINLFHILFTTLQLQCWLIAFFYYKSLTICVCQKTSLLRFNYFSLITLNNVLIHLPFQGFLAYVLVQGFLAYVFVQGFLA